MFKRIFMNVAVNLGLILSVVQGLLMLAIAVLFWYHSGDWVYMAIWVTGMVVLAIALIPAYRMHRANQKLFNQAE